MKRSLRYRLPAPPPIRPILLILAAAAVGAVIVTVIGGTGSDVAVGAIGFGALAALFYGLWLAGRAEESSRRLRAAEHDAAMVELGRTAERAARLAKEQAR